MGFLLLIFFSMDCYSYNPKFPIKKDISFREALAKDLRVLKSNIKKPVKKTAEVKDLKVSG